MASPLSPGAFLLCLLETCWSWNKQNLFHFWLRKCELEFSEGKGSGPQGPLCFQRTSTSWLKDRICKTKRRPQAASDNGLLPVPCEGVPWPLLPPPCWRGGSSKSHTACPLCCPSLPCSSPHSLSRSFYPFSRGQHLNFVPRGTPGEAGVRPSDDLLRSTESDTRKLCSEPGLCLGHLSHFLFKCDVAS